MNLIIDIGNTQYKICVFNKNKVIHSEFTETITKENIDHILKKHPITQGIFSSTRIIDDTKFRKAFPPNFKLIELNNEINLPIKIGYKTPHTLGKDRIAAAVGASVLFKNKATLIIDIGTALTIDFVNDEGTFIGGVISPGPKIRYQALSDYTGKLPLLEPTEVNDELSGQSTKEAIELGVQNGILFEINEYILRYTQKYTNLKVLLTGGYAYLFDKKINYPIFAELFLVPIGLNRILDYNDN